MDILKTIHLDNLDKILESSIINLHKNITKKENHINKKKDNIDSMISHLMNIKENSPETKMIYDIEINLVIGKIQDQKKINQGNFGIKIVNPFKEKNIPQIRKKYKCRTIDPPIILSFFSMDTNRIDPFGLEFLS